MAVRHEYRRMWRKPGSINSPPSLPLTRLRAGASSGLEAGALALALPWLAAYRQETYLQLP
jgi:hypothetical protein